MLYNYVKKKQPNVGGTRDYAFMPTFALPVTDLMGAGVSVPACSFCPFQPEQVYYNQAAVMNGIIGIVAGQIARVPLVDTRGITG